jgi:D-beta-D-heptose 7-phosphate kinase/D-beta-D-heptose 1-phosphate adenosyltransferase
MTLSADVECLSRARVLVVGDIMVDHYVHGAVQRVSEEAPVPILHVHSERHVPGGAANVAYNIASLGAQVDLLGVVGADPVANLLASIMEATPNITTHLCIASDRPTVLKTRYLGGLHQMIRVDREQIHSCGEKIEAEILEHAELITENVRVMVLSDYGKGVLSDNVLAGLFALAKRRDLCVIVDPKRVNFADYRGATIITPNRKELQTATGLPCETDEEAAAAAAKAIDASEANILLTRSERGMSYFANGQPPIHRAAEAQEVFDVSGAGDTVVATVAASLAAGLKIESGLALANAAAGVVVAKRGTATVSPGELSGAAGSAKPRRARLGSIVHDREAAVAQTMAWRREGLRVGFANGCFDLIHPGHVSLILQAAEACDRLVVALNTDASVKRLKGPTRPLQDEDARAAVMASIKGVAMVTFFDEDTPIELLRALSPDVIVKGADYREDQVVGADLVKKHGGRVLLVKLEESHSTSRIIALARSDGLVGSS